MSEPTPEAAPETPAQEPKAAEATPEQPATEEPRPEETDWKAEARKWEQRAKENNSAAQKLKEIEDAQKTQAEKDAERLAQAEKAAVDAKQEALRYRIAAKHGISEEDAELFLTATDEETLARQAQRFAERQNAEEPTSRSGVHVPSEGRSPKPAQALNSNGLENALKDKLGIS